MSLRILSPAPVKSATCNHCSCLLGGGLLGYVLFEISYDAWGRKFLFHHGKNKVWIVCFYFYQCVSLWLDYVFLFRGFFSILIAMHAMLALKVLGTVGGYCNVATVEAASLLGTLTVFQTSGWPGVRRLVQKYFAGIYGLSSLLLRIFISLSGKCRHAWTY